MPPAWDFRLRAGGDGGVCLVLGAADQRRKVLGVILVPLARRLALAEVELGVDGSDLEAGEVERGEEDRRLALKEVVDVGELVSGHVERDRRAIELEPVGRPHLRKPDEGCLARLEAEPDQAVVVQEIVLVDKDLVLLDLVCDCHRNPPDLASCMQDGGLRGLLPRRLEGRIYALSAEPPRTAGRRVRRPNRRLCAHPRGTAVAARRIAGGGRTSRRRSGPRALRSTRSCT